MPNATPRFDIQFVDVYDPTVSEYESVDAYRQAGSVSRGRQHELDRIEAGTAGLSLWNKDRRFDPLNTASPLVALLKPLRKLRITAVHGVTTYPVFSGVIEGWPVDWHSPDLSTLDLTAVDAFKLFGLQDVTMIRPSEPTSTRVNVLLDWAGWPAEWRTIETGHVTMPEREFDGTGLLAALQECADAEGGLIFAGRNGNVVFHNRHHRLANFQTSQVTLAGSGPLAFSKVKFTYDDSQIANIVRATASSARSVGGDGSTDGVEVTASNYPSEQEYGRRVLNLGDIKAGQLVVQDTVDYQVSRRAQPEVRVDSVTLHPSALNDLWPHVLGLEIGDRLTIQFTPPSGSAISREVHLEHITHQVKGGRWDTVWSFSPADLRHFWQLDSAVDGVLGSTTRTGY